MRRQSRRHDQQPLHPRRAHQPQPPVRTDLVSYTAEGGAEEEREEGTECLFIGHEEAAGGGGVPGASEGETELCYSAAVGRASVREGL